MTSPTPEELASELAHGHLRDALTVRGPGDTPPEAPERVMIRKGNNSKLSQVCCWDDPDGVEYVRADLLESGKSEPQSDFSRTLYTEQFVFGLQDKIEELETAITRWKIEEKAWEEETERLEALSADRTQYNIGKKFGLLEGQMDERAKVEALFSFEEVDNLIANAKTTEHRRIRERLEGLDGPGYTMGMDPETGEDMGEMPMISREEALKAVDDE